MKSKIVLKLICMFYYNKVMFFFHNLETYTIVDKILPRNFFYMLSHCFKNSFLKQKIKLRNKFRVIHFKKTKNFNDKVFLNPIYVNMYKNLNNMYKNLNKKYLIIKNKMKFHLNSPCEYINFIGKYVSKNYQTTNWLKKTIFCKFLIFKDIFNKLNSIFTSKSLFVKIDNFLNFLNKIRIYFRKTLTKKIVYCLIVIFYSTFLLKKSTSEVLALSNLKKSEFKTKITSHNLTTSSSLIILSLSLLFCNKKRTIMKKI